MTNISMNYDTVSLLVNKYAGRCDFCSYIFADSSDSRVTLSECVNPFHAHCDLDRPDCEPYKSVACPKCYNEMES